MTDEIITALSRVPGLFEIARTSTFTYKGKSVKVKQVSEELGVRYVLEGGFQKSADRIRITAQLIDALKGHHLWAERYDRDLKDIFALQDDITMKIISALQVKLTRGETVHRMEKGAKNIEAYLKLLEAAELIGRGTKEGIPQSKKLLEEAMALDPTNPARPRRQRGQRRRHRLDGGLRAAAGHGQLRLRGADADLHEGTRQGGQPGRPRLLAEKTPMSPN